MVERAHFLGEEILQQLFIAQRLFFREETAHPLLQQLGKLRQIGVGKQGYLFAVALAKAESSLGGVAMSATAIVEVVVVVGDVAIGLGEHGDAIVSG